MKEAYTQVLESEEDDNSAVDQIKPRDVGHNIYILAHQVCVWGGNAVIQGEKMWLTCRYHTTGPEQELMCCSTERFVIVHLYLCVCLP